MKNFLMTKIAVSFTVCVLLISCNAMKTAPYDQYSYQRAVEIKVDAARLIDNATAPYRDHEELADKLISDLDKMVVYEENKPHNGISLKMWKLLSDEDKNLLAGFIKRWKDEETLNPIFIDQAKPQINEAFDMMILYEGKKEKETENSLMQIIAGNQ